MSWRALGCGAAAAIVFVAMGIVALNLASGRSGCPDRLQDGPAAYRAEGGTTETPTIPGAAGESPVHIGTTLIGLTSRAVYALPADAPQEGTETRPDRLALDCADGTFQGYRAEVSS